MVSKKCILDFYVFNYGWLVTEECDDSINWQGIRGGRTGERATIGAAVKDNWSSGQHTKRIESKIVLLWWK
jgi:hypothetical protein